MMKPTNGLVTKDNPETMMKLLDSTDSDVEWLNLPPLKGKKPKKKKTSKPILHNNNSYSSGCTLWCFLKVFLAIAVITALCLLSIVITWMSGEITDLRDRLKSVESRSQSSVQDLNSFMVKLSDVNKTIHSVQNGKNSLNEVIKNISYINNEISELSNKVNKLSEGLKAAPEIRNIPDKLLTVSKTVADLGSEVTVMKGQFDSFSQFVKTAETKLEELSNQVTNGSGMSSRPTDRADLTPDLAHLIQNIPGQLHSLNISLMTQMSLLQSELTEHEQRFGILENKTATLSKSLSTVSHPSMPAMPGSSDIQSNPVDLKTQVDAILQEMMRNSSSSLGIVSLDKTTMLELLANMDNLTVTVQQLKDDYGKLLEAKTSPGSIDTNNNNNGNLEQLLRSYDQSFNLRITTMNTSLTNLQHDFAHYVTIIGQHSNQLVDITNQINQIGRFLRPSVGNTTPPPQRAKPTSAKAKTPGIFNQPATSDSETGSKQTTRPPAATTQAPPRTTRDTEASETEAKVNKTPTGTTSAPKGTTLGPGGGAQSTLAPMKKQEGTTKGPSGEEGQEGETKTTGQADSGAKTEGPEAASKPPAIVSPRIKNMAELELNFRRWDIMGNRKVLYGILPGYLGESNMPSEEVLEEYDTNGDGLYSLRELANAFGFNFEDLPADNPFRVHDVEDNER